MSNQIYENSYTNNNLRKFLFKKVLSKFENTDANSLNKNLNQNVYNNQPFINNIKNNYNNYSKEIKQLLKYSIELFNINKKLKEYNQHLKQYILIIEEEHLEISTKLTASESRLETEILKSSVNPHNVDNIDNICTICFSETRDCVYINCGHLCACSNCCQVIGNKCPICRSDSAYIRVFR